MGEPVACEPRLFVGQVPAEAREEDLWPLFTPFGTVRNLHLLKGGDGKPRGCAMVLFARWAQAEAAAEALDGAAALDFGGKGRPLVVHFANPRRSPPGQPAEPGIAPRKLFVGQVPRDVVEESLRPLFEPFGEIEQINILRTHRGQSAGCAFVQFRKWAQAEAAMEAHNGKTRLGTLDVPLVVKFADAKRKDAGMGLALGTSWGPANLASLGHLGQDFGHIGLGDDGGLGNLAGLASTAGLENGMMDQSLLLNTMGMGNLGGVVGSGGGGYGGVAALHEGGGLGNGLLGGPLGPPMNPGLDNLGLQLHGLGNGHFNALLGPDGACYGGAPLQLGVNMPHGPADSLASDFGGLGMGGGGGGRHLSGPAPGMLRQWGQKIGSNDKFNDWKLFIGQVSLEATEEELYALFSPVGDILELYILRNSNGKSRGCAFVTYANKFLAQQAITQLNGKQVPPGKTLVVKFADRAIASKTAGAAVDPLLASTSVYM